MRVLAWQRWWAIEDPSAPLPAQREAGGHHGCFHCELGLMADR